MPEESNQPGYGEESYGELYTEFTENLVKGKVYDAMSMLRKYPDIIGMLGPSEIEVAYMDIRKKDAIEAYFFKGLVLKRGRQMWKSIREIEKSLRRIEARRLEQDLMNLDEKHQKMIQEMKDNSQHALDPTDVHLEELLSDGEEDDENDRDGTEFPDSKDEKEDWR